VVARIPINPNNIKPASHGNTFSNRIAHAPPDLTWGRATRARKTQLPNRIKLAVNCDHREKAAMNSIMIYSKKVSVGLTTSGILVAADSLPTSTTMGKVTRLKNERVSHKRSR
jgi:hypothetical protein